MYFDILMLRVLADEPQHGYEIKKRVERILGGRSINNNVLYPALRRFGEQGAIVGIGREREHQALQPSVGAEGVVNEVGELRQVVEERVDRGSGSINTASDARSAIRSHRDPATRILRVGFRVARSPKAKAGT